MRIIYGRDYYDNALAYGQDEAITFIRERDHYCDDKHLEGGAIFPPSFDLRVRPKSRHFLRYYFSGRAFDIEENGKRISLFLRPFKIIVCGKTYQGIGIERIATRKYEVIWNKRDLFDWFESHDLQMDIWSYTARKGRDRYIENAADSYFAPQDVSKDSLAWLIENKVTIATYSPRISEPAKWRINGDDLKDFHFYKVVDPYTLFQEISMWIGGVLPGSSNPMVQITDDNIKVAKHGFDTKWSFRKQGKSSAI